MPEKPSPVTVNVVAEPGKVAMYECSPPGSSGCQSLLGTDLLKWRRVSVSKKLLDPPDFKNNPELEYVKDWIVQLVEREMGKWFEPTPELPRIKVQIDAVTAEAITKALLRKAKAGESSESSPPSCSTGSGPSAS
jgi:hypothetical protein